MRFNSDQTVWPDSPIMGLVISRKPRSEQKLAYQMRKQNCKLTKRIYKIIEEAYKDNYLNEYEFHATIGWYYGLKFRHSDSENELFVIALDKINDLVCTMIQERYSEQIGRSLATQPLMPPGRSNFKDLTDKESDRLRKLLEDSPYLKLSKWHVYNHLLKM